MLWLFRSLELTTESFGALALTSDGLFVYRAYWLSHDIKLIVDRLFLMLNGLFSVFAYKVPLKVSLILLARRGYDLWALSLSLLSW